MENYGLLVYQPQKVRYVHKEKEMGKSGLPHQSQVL